MRNLIGSLLIALTYLHANAAETIAMAAAVKIAEAFIAQNGYTTLPASQLKQLLPGFQASLTQHSGSALSFGHARTNLENYQNAQSCNR